jgi:hypothetical protein
MRAYQHIKDLQYCSKFLLWCKFYIKIQPLYLPSQNTANDENFTPWGVLSRQCLTLKALKFGIKTFQTMRIKNMIFVFSCIHRQKHGPRVEPDHSWQPQNGNCNTGTFTALVWSWTYTVDWLQQSRISKEAKDRTFHWLCWHTIKLNKTSSK